MEHVVKILDILTDLPVLIAIAVIYYRKPIGRIFEAAAEDYLPDLVRRASRIRAGPVQVDLSEFRDSVANLPSDLVKAILLQLNPEAGLAEPTESIDNLPASAPVESLPDVDEDEPAEEADSDEYQRRLADLMKGDRRNG